jgi:uncharacterized membrane protein YhhN
MKNNIIIAIFWLLCLTDFVANTFNFTALAFLIKPLLMPCLLFLFFKETNLASGTGSRLLVVGLIFCWLGDVLLMFEYIDPIFFILGLAGFLFGHIFYIFYFNKLSSAPQKLKEKKLLILLPVVLYVLLLLYILYPSLGDLKIPVIIYSIVLASMLSTALWQGQKIDSAMAKLFIAGAISFVLSDSLLALNKFFHPFSAAGFLIMFTYCLAQYLIVLGGIKEFRKQQSAG